MSEEIQGTDDPVWDGGDKRVKEDDQADDLGALAKALAKAQGEIKEALKDSQNPHFKSNYATLAATWEACRGPLSKHGLSVVQRGKVTPDGYVMRTRLLHESGQWIEGEVPCITGGRQQQNEMQQLGSAITYARRYGLASMVGVAPEGDDDAETSEVKAKPKHGTAPILGKYKKQELEEKMRAFDGELHLCEDMGMLMGLVHSYADALDQCERELASWYYGKEGSDAPGIADRIKTKRQEIRRKEAEEPPQ